MESFTNLVHRGINVLEGEVVEAAEDTRAGSAPRSPSSLPQPSSSSPSEQSTYLRPMTLTAMSFQRALTVTALNLDATGEKRRMVSSGSPRFRPHVSPPPSSHFLFASLSQDSLWDHEDSYEMTEAQADDGDNELNEEEEDWDGGLDENLKEVKRTDRRMCGTKGKQGSARLLLY